MNKEKDVVYLELAVTEPVSIIRSLLQIEFRRLGSFQHKDLMCHLVAHFSDIQSIVVRNQFVIFVLVLLFNESSPHLFGYKSLLINSIEKDQNSTT